MSAGPDRDADRAQVRNGVRRSKIIYAAAERFGRDGFEETKWADVARDVGVGPSALYHYFESKLHCLFVIMAETLADLRARFDRIRAAAADPVVALHGMLEATFELSEHEIMLNRLLIAEQGLMSSSSRFPREERARQTAQAQAREVDFAWTTVLARAMQARLIPEADPRLLSRSLVGLHTSIWHWYRPGGPVELDSLRVFYIDRTIDLLMVGEIGGST